jgi:hypothetical protein
MFDEHVFKVVGLVGWRTAKHPLTPPLECYQLVKWSFSLPKISYIELASRDRPAQLVSGVCVFAGHAVLPNDAERDRLVAGWLAGVGVTARFMLHQPAQIRCF